MSLDFLKLQQWLIKNRLVLWWMIYIPFLALILFFNRDQLNLQLNEINNFIISPQYKIFNSTLIINLARVTLVAIGAVIIMICLFFPLFQVSKEGIQWTREFEEELTKVSGEITGEEVNGLIQGESFRWSLIYGWLKLEEKDKLEPQFILRELLATLWDAFPDQRLSLIYIDNERKFALYHPLLTKLIISEPDKIDDEDSTFGLKLKFSEDSYFTLHIFNDQEGFSTIDEKFILVLGEVFLSIAKKEGVLAQDLLAYFEQIPLTSMDNQV